MRYACATHCDSECDSQCGRYALYRYRYQRAYEEGNSAEVGICTTGVLVMGPPSLAGELNAAEIHRRLAGSWPGVLERLGVDPTHLRKRKSGPCPACGGRDRFTFDDRNERGDYVCRGCGAGDGFSPLQKAHGWTFTEARKAVLEVAGLRGERADRQAAPRSTVPRKPEVAGPTARVKALLRTATKPDHVPDCIAYLQSRKLWPLPPGCSLRAHVGLDYFRAAHREAVEAVGRFPALVGVVCDIEGEAVTAHVTYLHNGAKLSPHEPRKLLSPVAGRVGCAVRLLPMAGDVLAVGEGLETSLAAAKLHDLPTWAALNAALLAKFVPPPEIRQVVIFADRDVAGLQAAWDLREQLDGRCTVELRVPAAPFNDWAEVLEAQQ